MGKPRKKPSAAAIHAEVGRLRKQANERFDRADYAGALRLGRKLKRLRHTSAFEVMGRAYWEMDKRQKAIAVLKEGVKVGASVWVLWDQLGCYYSDLGQYAKAVRALTHAADCPHADLTTVLYNLSLVHLRQGRAQKAWDVIRKAKRPSSAWERARLNSIKVETLSGLGQFEVALRLANRALRDAHSLNPHTATNNMLAPDETGAEILSRLYADRAEIRWLGNHDKKRSLEDLLRAVELDRTNPRAMRLMREIEQRTSKSARYFRVLVQGRWPTPIMKERRAPGFIAPYHVVADNPQEALEFIRRFEPTRVRPTLQVHECEQLESRSRQPKGVYWLGGRFFFPLRNKAKRKR